jgi:hypothetical protein
MLEFCEKVRAAGKAVPARHRAGGPHLVEERTAGAASLDRSSASSVTVQQLLQCRPKRSDGVTLAACAVYTAKLNARSSSIHVTPRGKGVPSVCAHVGVFRRDSEPVSSNAWSLSVVFINRVADVFVNRVLSLKLSCSLAKKWRFPSSPAEHLNPGSSNASTSLSIHAAIRKQLSTASPP